MIINFVEIKEVCSKTGEPIACTHNQTICFSVFHRKYYTRLEMEAILYHELCHAINNESYNLSDKNYNHQLEYKADEFAAKILGKLPVISFLEKMKERTIDEETITHPSLTSRIENIRNKFL